MKLTNPLPIVGVIAALSLLGEAQNPVSDKSPCVWLSSDVIGMKVVTPKGETLGKLEDVVVHPGGEGAYAVLSFGGTWGMGDKLFALPWSVLRTVEADAAKKVLENSIVLPLDKERMKDAPGFDRKNWPAMVQPDWAKEINAFYAVDRGTSTPRPVEAAARTSVITWRVTDLEGAEVKTPGGDELGRIKEVAIDTNGRVSYVALSVGGFLGIGDTQVAVPWEALKFTQSGEKNDQRAITLATNKAQLEKAPQFKAGKEKAVEMCDPKWIGSVYDYFSVKPYWPRTAAPKSAGL